MKTLDYIDKWSKQIDKQILAVKKEDIKVQISPKKKELLGGTKSSFKFLQFTRL